MSHKEEIEVTTFFETIEMFLYFSQINGEKICIYICNPCNLKENYLFRIKSVLLQTTLR